jgi:DNA-binding NarL/FixJ family response regulator
MDRSASDGPPKLRVSLAIADFPMLTAGLRATIDAEPDLIVVDELGPGESIREHVGASQADVIIAECLPCASHGRATTETIETIRAAKPSIGILALECRSNSEQFSLALKAGADGFLTREAAPTDVLGALRAIRAGQTYVSPSIVTKMVQTYLLKAPQGPLEDVYDRLSEREKEVLLLAAVGNTNREIARILHLSEQTVHNYRATVMEKLGFHDRVELLKYAIRRGVVDPADL